MSNQVRTRFAPSPTGRLHLGNVRTALFNYLLARAAGGAFLLRLEDTDADRSSAAAEEAISDDLRWLGLHWHEGPGAGGDAGPYRQSERRGIHDDYIARLIAERRAYECWRTDEELAEHRRRCLEAGSPPIYDREWGRLPEQEVARRRAEGGAPAIRFRVPDSGVVESVDCVRGPQRFSLSDVGDFVIRRSDGSPAFFFSNALDDALMGVTHVLRGDDHLSNTPRQILLLEALGLPAPVYGHLPLLLGTDGKPLSKRGGSAGMAQLRAERVLPTAICNYAARLGHAFDSGELMPLEALAGHFDLARVGRAPARFDPVQLDHWQALAIQEAQVPELIEWAGEAALSEVPEALRERFLEAVRPNVHRPADVARWADILFGPGPDFPADMAADLEAAGAVGFFRAALEGLEESKSLAAITGAVKARCGVRGKALFRPLRLALTGTDAGPELAQVVELMPEATLRSRLAGWAGS